MMALHPGGRPGSSRRVRLVPVRRSGLDHRAVARIVLALARQMAAEADETVSSDAVACSRNEPGTSDGSAAASDDAAVPWTDAHRGQSARGGTTAGRCAANESMSASAESGLAGRCAHQRHDGAHHSLHEDAAPSSTPGGTP